VILSFLRSMADTLLSLVYPRQCIVCGTALAIDTDDSTCEPCAQALLAMPKPDANGYDKGFAFAQSFAAYPYADAARNMILRYKSEGHITAVKDIALHIFERIAPCDLPAVDLLVPVPSHKSRIKKRGFVPTILLVEQLAPLYHFPVSTDALCATRATLRQSELDAAARKQNVKDAYAVRDASIVAGKTILLFDDVLTTGATMDSCAKELLAAGAKEVHTLSIAVTAHGME